MTRKHMVGTREQWLAARLELLACEKEHTRRGDELARMRRELPWVPVEKPYRFATEHGDKTLAELFDGRSQLIVYHFMFGPDYNVGCPSCSSAADCFDGAIVHLEQRDVTMLCVSRAPLERLLAYRQRMGWRFDWASSLDSDFNADFGVSFTDPSAVEYNYRAIDVRSILDAGVGAAEVAALAGDVGTDPAGYMTELPGLSVFALEDGNVYHTYSAYARGSEFLLTFYGLLDRAPKGRAEGSPPHARAALERDHQLDTRAGRLTRFKAQHTDLAREIQDRHDNQRQPLTHQLTDLDQRVERQLAAIEAGIDPLLVGERITALETERDRPRPARHRLAPGHLSRPRRGVRDPRFATRPSRPARRGGSPTPRTAQPSGLAVTMRAMLRAPSLAAVRRLADARSVERGDAYFAEGRVGRVVVGADDVQAAVDGTHRYRVVLRDSDTDELGYACDCPLGLEGVFCKHCVAVCLAWRAEPEQRGAARPVGRDGLRQYLSARPHNALVELLLDAAERDERLRERLLMAAATGGERAQRIATFRTSIDRAVATRGFVSYSEMWDYTAGIGEAIAGLDGLLAKGHAPDVVELCEHALATVEAAMHELDDSDGRMSDILGRVQELHLKACRRAKPEPRALAQKLLEWELNGHWDTFSGAAETYSRVLGKAGRARYRELAEHMWGDLPELAPGDQRGYDGRRFSITRIMESFARDIDELIDVMARDLSSGYQFLRIAEALHAAGRHDDALAWAANGLDAFADRPDGRLVDFLAEEHARRGEHRQATRLCWEAYTRRPCLDTYAKLAERARPAGEWAKRRERALELLSIKTRGSAERRSPGAVPRDSSELVRVHLWENDTDAAWRQANESGCSADLWLELANRRRDRHPEDALQVYLARIQPAIELRDKRGYQQAVHELGEIRTLLGRLDRHDEFSALVANLRERHGRKRNLIKLLDEMHGDTAGENAIANVPRRP